MKVLIKKAELQGSIPAIPSKSYAHRMLISAALAGEESFIGCPTVSEDIRATAGCMAALCADVIREEKGYRVIPKKAAEKAVLNCGESGSTYRFLLPVAAALGTETEFQLFGRLPERPMEDLYRTLEQNGVQIQGRNTGTVTVSGKLSAGDYEIPADISSQFISGLLFALPLLEGDSRIILKGKLASASYVGITRSVLAEYGIVSDETEYGYLVRGNQCYRAEKNMRVEGDWSNAAFWLSAGAMSERPVACSGLNLNSIQGDRAVAEILRRFGAKIAENDGTVTVCGGSLRGIEVDAEDVPDLVPVLAAVACTAEGQTRFDNAGRLRAKESDRIAAVKNALENLGGCVRETPDGLIVTGGKLHGGTVDSCGDHRIAMMAAVAAAAADGEITIRNAESVRKSYPGFYEDFAALGGEVKEI